MPLNIWDEFLADRNILKTIKKYNHFLNCKYVIKLGATHNHINVVKFVIDFMEKYKMITPHFIMNYFEHGISCAGYEGNVVIIQYFVDYLDSNTQNSGKNSDMLNYVWKNGLTQACFRGHHDIVRLVIDRVDQKDFSLYLLHACKGFNVFRFCDAEQKVKHLDVIKIILLKAQTRISGVAESIKTTCLKSNYTIFNLLKKHVISYGIKINWQLMFDIACIGRHLETIKSCLEQDVTYLTDGFRRACENDNAQIVKFLTGEHNKNGYLTLDKTPGLCAACRNGYLDIINIIIKDTSDTMDWNSAFKSACEGGDIECVHTIVNVLKNIDEPVPWNIGMMVACKSSNIDIVNLAIKNGANAWDLGLLNARHCKNSDKNIIKLMIENGANNNDDKNNTDSDDGDGDVDFDNDGDVDVDFIEN